MDVPYSPVGTEVKEGAVREWRMQNYDRQPAAVPRSLLEEVVYGIDELTCAAATGVDYEKNPEQSRQIYDRRFPQWLGNALLTTQLNIVTTTSQVRNSPLLEGHALTFRLFDGLTATTHALYSRSYRIFHWRLGVIDASLQYPSYLRDFSVQWSRCTRFEVEGLQKDLAKVAALQAASDRHLQSEE